MRVLLTGSNGLLGQKLVELLRKQPDITLLATAKGKNRLPSKEGYTFQSLDILDHEAVKTAIDDFKPEVIIHTAAMTHVDKCQAEKELCWQINVSAVENIALICAAKNIFLIHLSTDFVFDGLAGPYTETDFPSPVNFYGWSKLAAEHQVIHSSAPSALVRTVLVYGIAHDMSRSNIILWTKNNLENKKPIKVVTDQWRTPTLVEDLAVGCLLILRKKATGIFNISGSDFLTPFEMATKTAQHLSLDSTLISPVTAATFAEPDKRPARTGLVIDKAIRELGYSPTSFEIGLANVLKQAERLAS